MSPPLPRIKKGEPPGFAQADFGNAIIQAIDDLRNLVVSPQGFGTLSVGAKGGVILDLSGVETALSTLRDLVQTIVNNGGGGGGSSSDLRTLTERVSRIEDRLNNATVECNEDGTVTLRI